MLQTLKQIALLGGIKNKVEISSFELSRQIGSSQQSASRYLLDLDKMGMITRELSIRKQLIQITHSGENVLHEEFLQYRQIFEYTDRIIFKGRVVSGLGEGRYYTEQDGYVQQFKEKIGFIPYPGTLNVEIDFIERNKLKLLRNHNGITIDEFSTDDRSFGGVRCYMAKINDIDGAIVLPLRTHYSNILEFISPVFLREKLNLSDGDTVDVVIFINDIDEV